ncbi:class I SAM-dependent DNA methyltransferase [Catellatospora citrea]|uniref:Methyltransferase n=1 Tax=Catellatospora citrea TaxID=53366 RepID=A0A8J3KHJ6_9ACTN|nr:class I SAM-dependent methyltransferase [Catellatospora citrea]RKE12770.1 methyltransferase family protein [Catellatospora citrea]GIF95989.1 methyltransferase [Catellatospora citrea]
MTEPTFLQDTRTAYDTFAVEYADTFRDELAGIPIERAMLAAYADLVLAGGGGATLDVGCGTGPGTAHLAGLGLDVRGLDLSPGMLALARSRYPQLRFDEGTMTALDVADGSLAGISAQYSVIHIPDEELPSVLAGFRRALATGGHLLLIFQNLDEHRLRTEAFGHTFTLNYHFRSVDRMAEFVTGAGFDVFAQASRKAQPGEATPRGMLLARAC